MTPLGRTHWAVAGGHAPSRGCGDEPEFTSHDRLCLLNAGDAMANVEITIVHAGREPVGPYRITVAPRRVRVVRVNDLIFPEAVPLDADYAAQIDCDVPIVVQFTRQDTRQAALARLGATAFAG